MPKSVLAVGAHFETESEYVSSLTDSKEELSSVQVKEGYAEDLAPTLEVMPTRQNNELAIFNDKKLQNTLSSTAFDTFVTPTSNSVYKYGTYVPTCACLVPGCDVDSIHRYTFRVMATVTFAPCYN